ncbi:importin-11 [Patella vulgata]|uniref:importin-11 n=1 Tax=Patella vulgata TaxID=6465 RepID=UPI00217FCD3A|nr:importin-11 [Patella vulgata]
MDLTSDETYVLDTLGKACSQSAQTLKPAVEQLQQWEIQPGFYSILSKIFSNHNIDVNVRWLAVMYCKNGVDKYWRKSAPNSINEEEKETIKSRSISNFNEPSPQVTLQLAVLIAKIARLDCPRNWNDLLPTLFQAIRCSDGFIQERALLVFHHVTKTLASKRLAVDRKIFEELTAEIFSFILSVWNTYVDQFFQLAAKHEEGMAAAIDRCNLSLKILRKLIAFGFKDLTTCPDAVSFINSIFQRLDQMLDCRRTMWGNHLMVEKCEKLVVTLTKVLIDTLEMHPIAFVQFVRTSLEFVVRYNFTAKGLLFERFVVNCFNLMKGILFCDVYKPPKNPQDSSSISMQAHKILTEFFTYDTLSEICRRLVSQYFLLTSDDLLTWEADPEDFCQEEVGDSYKYSLRPCTEVLFLTVFKEFRLTLTSVLLQMVQANQGPCDPDNLEALLKKDAVYNAVGLASFDLFDDINFDQWFLTHLVQELQIKHFQYRIIRRRVIWLIGQWVGVKMSVNLRPMLYEIILSLLSKDEDLAVRLEAAQCLKTAVDDFEFKTEQLLPYLESLFALLFELLKEVRECDTKMHVLHVLSFVIERVGSKIQPYTSALVQYLPQLWHESGEHNMLRCAILTTLIHLVQGFGTTCIKLYDFLIPVIEMSTDVNQDQHVYLLEDGLELWDVTLQNSPHLTDKLLKIFNQMPALLELGTENLRICLKVIEAYVLLGPHEFMQAYSAVLVPSFSSLMTDIRAEGLVMILRVIEVVFKTFPTEGPQVFQPILKGIVRTVIDGEENPVVLSMYLSLCARVLLQNHAVFWSILETVAVDTQRNTQQLLRGILDTWVERIDSITQPERRKISALAMASLLSINHSIVVEKFNCIINLCVEVLHDVCQRDDNGAQTDTLVIGEDEVIETSSYPPDDNYSDIPTEHDTRRKNLSRKDPVHTVSLKEYVMSQLTQCQQVHGQMTFDRIMGELDPEIIQQLQELCS